MCGHAHVHTHTCLVVSHVPPSVPPLQLNELSMREEIGDYPLRFELTDRKKTKYLFQASTREKKEEWVSDLRDLFYEQMVALKGLFPSEHPSRMCMVPHWLHVV